MRLLKVVILIGIMSSFTLFFQACSGGVDRSNFTPQQRFEYALSLYKEESYLEAVIEFESILIQYPGSDVADDAEYYLGMTRYKKGELLLGAYEFSKLIRNMPASPYVSDSQFMLAECYFELSPHSSLDQTYTKKAIQEFQAFIEYFKTDERGKDAEAKIRRLNNKLAEKFFNSARIYEKMDYYAAALNYYEDVISLYHDTPFAPQASYAKISLLSQKGRKKEALKEVNVFISRYPNDKMIDDIKNLKKSLEEEAISAQ